MRGARARAVFGAAMLITVLFLAVPRNAAAYAPHEPIRIEGDADFTAENGVTGGHGTSADPYVIEGWEITGPVGIDIRNTTAHFAIRNSYVRDTSEAIHLQNLTHATIVGNVLWNGGYGVIAFWVSDLIVTRNTIATDFPTVWGGGVHPFRSNDVLISENRITRMGDGVYIQDSTNVTVVGNRIEGDDDRSEGVRLWVSTDVTIVCNDLIDHSIGVRVFTWNTGIVVHHNNVLGSAYAQAQDGEANAWDDGYPSGGNHWSDYVGQDRYRGPNQDEPGSDGIGDTPYGIDGDSRDRYPLMAPAACTQAGPTGLVSLGLIPATNPTPGSGADPGRPTAGSPSRHERPCGDEEGMEANDPGPTSDPERPHVGFIAAKPGPASSTMPPLWLLFVSFAFASIAVVRRRAPGGEKP